MSTVCPDCAGQNPNCPTCSLKDLPSGLTFWMHSTEMRLAGLEQRHNPAATGFLFGIIVGIIGTLLSQMFF